MTSPQQTIEGRSKHFGLGLQFLNAQGKFKWYPKSTTDYTKRDMSSNGVIDQSLNRLVPNLVVKRLVFRKLFNYFSNVQISNDQFEQSMLYGWTCWKLRRLVEQYLGIYPFGQTALIYHHLTQLDGYVIKCKLVMLFYLFQLFLAHLTYYTIIAHLNKMIAHY